MQFPSDWHFTMRLDYYYIFQSLQLTLNDLFFPLFFVHPLHFLTHVKSELVYFWDFYLCTNLILFKHCCLIPATFSLLFSKLSFSLTFYNSFLCSTKGSYLRCPIPLLFPIAQIRFTSCIWSPKEQVGMLCRSASGRIHT